MTRTKAGRLSNAVPVKPCELIVPAGVKVCVWVPSAEPLNVGVETVPVRVACVPVNVSAGTVPAEPVNVCAATVELLPVNVGLLFVGTPAGHALLPVAVVVCVCVLRADPVNTGALTVPAGVLAEAKRATEVLPLAAFVVSLIAVPVNVGAEFVPAGVPPLTAELVTELPVNTGTPAGQLIVGVLTVPAGVTVDVAFVPAGVKLAEPLVPAGV